MDVYGANAGEITGSSGNMHYQSAGALQPEMQVFGRDDVLRETLGGRNANLDGLVCVQDLKTIVKMLGDIEASLASICALVENIGISGTVKKQRFRVLGKARVIDRTSRKAPVEAVQHKACVLNRKARIRCQVKRNGHRFY